MTHFYLTAQIENPIYEDMYENCREDSSSEAVYSESNDDRSISSEKQSQLTGTDSTPSTVDPDDHVDSSTEFAKKDTKAVVSEVEYLNNKKISISIQL